MTTTTTRVAGVGDTHRVLLAVTGSPLVANPYNSVRVVPEEIVLLYRRENTDTTYTLARIEVFGSRAHRDGTPGVARSDVSFELGRFGDGHPDAWLLRLGATYLPAGPPVAAQFPPSLDDL